MFFPPKPLCNESNVRCPIRWYIIHLAQLSNLIGPFVPRDRPEKKRYWTARLTILDGPPGNHRNNVKIAILDVRLTQIRQTRKDDNVSG